MMMLFSRLFAVVAFCLSTVLATLATYSPTNGITYSVGIPSSTASAGNGDVYFQISGPTSYTWIAIGIGQRMAGATIFVMYADGTGNVTISPRTGVGHVMPMFDSTAEVTLLAGSGVSNGVMTANVKYAAASGLISLSSTSSGWIGSYKSGDPLNSKDQSQTINQHDDYAVYTLDLSKAQLAADSNPFVSTTGSSPSQTSTASGSSSSPTGSSSSGGSSGSDNSGSAVTYVDPVTTYEMAHGSIMAATMVVLFPLGSILMRLSGGIWAHAAIQLFGLAAIIAGFGLGVHLAQMSGLLFNNAHTIFGTVIVCLFFVQPLIGLLHHRQYLNLGRRSFFGVGHMWYGRILMICGIINGGLGLQLAANSSKGNIAYGVVAGAVFVIYIVVVLATGLKKRNAEKTEASSP